MKRLFIYIAIGLLFSPAVYAQDTQVDPKQSEKYRNLSPEEKKKLHERWERLKKMNPEDRDHMSQMVKRFREMSPERREKIRERIERLTPEQRERFQNAMHRYHQFAQKSGIPSGARSMFMKWLKEHRPENLDAIKNLSPEERQKKRRELMTQFQNHVIDRLVKDGTIQAGEADELKRRPQSDQWKRLREVFHDRAGRGAPNHKERRKE